MFEQYKLVITKKFNTQAMKIKLTFKIIKTFFINLDRYKISN